MTLKATVEVDFIMLDKVGVGWCLTALSAQKKRVVCVKTVVTGLCGDKLLDIGIVWKRPG